MAPKGTNNLSPGVNLETARFLTDAQLVKEYERMQDPSTITGSSWDRAWRNPKIRGRILEISRLVIFALLIWAVISIISHLGLWVDIYQWIITAL